MTTQNILLPPGVTSDHLEKMPWSVDFNLDHRTRSDFEGSKSEPTQRSFPAMQKSLCSIKGLLTQCTDVSGVRYLIDKNVAEGQINFGNATDLDGKAWVKAFENTLQTEQAEWLEFPGGISRKESLVLIPIGINHVMVVPKHKAAAYQKQFSH